MHACSWLQSSRTLCNLVDCSLPGSPVHGILQARKLEWVLIPFSRGCSQPRDLTCISCITGKEFPDSSPGRPDKEVLSLKSKLGLLEIYSSLFGWCFLVTGSQSCYVFSSPLLSFLHTNFCVRVCFPGIPTCNINIHIECNLLEKRSASLSFFFSYIHSGTSNKSSSVSIYWMKLIWMKWRR